MTHRQVCTYYERGLREAEIAEHFGVRQHVVRMILEQNAVKREAFAFRARELGQWFLPVPKRSRHRDHVETAEQLEIF